jgi:3-hydroxyisobutyrate dehydrogenase-like beta-hydroxyacid dehydrogenase
MAVMHDVLALIGFGEAGEAFARAAGWGSSVRAYDVLDERKAVMGSLGIRPAGDPAEAVAEAGIVLSLVTADQARPAAEQCAPLLAPGAIWCDCNSVAPETKRAAARCIEAAGGHYVDVAVLAPVEPALLGVPLLLSGKAAGIAESRLRAAGFTNLRIVGDEVGRASTIKLIRSVMIKGIEALTAEMMAAAERAGVVDEVLSSLDASERRDPWRERAAYNLQRMVQHGHRRAAEMEEAAETLTGLGVEPVMTLSTVRRQREMAEKGVAQ